MAAPLSFACSAFSDRGFTKESNHIETRHVEAGQSGCCQEDVIYQGRASMSGSFMGQVCRIVSLLKKSG